MSSLLNGSGLSDRKGVSEDRTPHYAASRVTLNSMAQPTKIYNAASIANAEDKSPGYLGEFVYIDGGFRYLDRQVLQARSCHAL